MSAANEVALRRRRAFGDDPHALPVGRHRAGGLGDHPAAEPPTEPEAAGAQAFDAREIARQGGDGGRRRVAGQEQQVEPWW